MRYVLLAFLLAGCATPEEQGQRVRQQILQQEEQREAYTRQVVATCRAYGFIPQTPAWSNCMMQVDMANRAQNQQLQNMLLQQFLNQQPNPMPLCSSLPPGLQGYERAGGRCR